jgi:hypothetical protein
MDSGKSRHVNTFMFFSRTEHNLSMMNVLMNYVFAIYLYIYRYSNMLYRDIYIYIYVSKVYIYIGVFFFERIFEEREREKER